MIRPTLLICLLFAFQMLNAQPKIDERYVQKQFNIVANFSNQNFTDDMAFRRTEFNQYVEFDKATFENVAYYTRTSFNFQSSFKKTHFKDVVYFNGSEFKGFADFSNARFDSIARFRSVHFSNVVEFQTVAFNEVNFRHAKFDEPVNFIGSKFNDYVTFNRAHFKSDVDFSNVTFKAVSFYKVIFERSPDFSFAELPDTIFLEKIAFRNDAIIDLNPVKPKKYVIDLRQFPMDKIKLRWDIFSLYIPTGREYNYREIRSVYIDLLKRFKDLGYTESYEACDREFKAFVYLNDPDMYLGPVRNLLSKYWWGYGYDLWKIVVNTLIILLILSIINYRIFDQLNSEVYKIASLYSRTLPVQGKVISSLERYFVVLQYTSAIFFGFNLNMGEWKYKKEWKVVWLQIQFGLGLLCLAFVVNYFFT